MSQSPITDDPTRPSVAADVSAADVLEGADDVSERRKHEAARRLAELRAQAAFEASPDAITITRLADSHLVDVNDGAAALFGWSKHELVERTAIALGLWDDPAIRDQLLALASRQGTVSNVEARIRRKDHACVTALVSGRLVSLEGEPHLLLIFRDITDRKHADQLRQSRQRIVEAAATLSLDALLTMILDETAHLTSSEVAFYHFVEADQRTLSLQAWSTRTVRDFCRAEGKGQHYHVDEAGVWVDCIHERRPVIHNDYAGLTHKRGLPEGHAPVIRELVVPILRNDLIVAVLGVGNKPGDYTPADVDTVNYIADVGWEVTQRKRAEEQRNEGHELLANLARLVPGVIYQYRLYPDGRSAFPYASPGMEDIYEVTPEEVRTDATPVFGRILPDDANRVSEAIYESARTLETFYCEFRVLLPRQGLRWRWSQAQPVRLQDGSTLWHGIILDVTDRKQAEVEKATLESQLQQAQKMESVGRLAGGVAHDFNNMLGVILGHTELALNEVVPTSPVYDSLSEIRNAANRSADLTRQLLAFARRQAIAPKVLDINETVAGMVTMLQRLIGEDVRLIWSATPGLWPIKADPSQVDQLLANLCVNARDAITGAGRVAIQLDNVTLDVAGASRRDGVSAGDYVRIAVTDDGCGMNEETRAHAFEPFFTTKAVGKGTGLGLATVYGIVRQNSGYVDVESEVGRGTTIAVHFPRVDEAVDGLSDPERQSSTERGHETVLIAEDEPAVLAMATQILERLGYRVLPANSTNAALRYAAEVPGIALLLTDVVMPDMNGRDLADRVLAHHPDASVVFMSGYTSDVIAQQGVLDEGLTFLQKPFSIETLAATVRAVLDRR